VAKPKGEEAKVLDLKRQLKASSEEIEKYRQMHADVQAVLDHFRNLKPRPH
jgi:hypothetical protein